MDRVYRAIWSCALGVWVAVPETAKAHGKGKASKSLGNRASDQPTATSGVIRHTALAVVALLFSLGTASSVLAQASVVATDNVLPAPSSVLGPVWDVTDPFLIIGDSSRGRLEILDGGRVNNSKESALGWQAGSEGSALVSGKGSQWNAGEMLTMGVEGRGTLVIEKGGVVNSGYGYAGREKEGAGEVIVKGEGSRWTLSEYIIFGEKGEGTLTIQDGGLVQTADLGLGDGRGTGTLNLLGDANGRGVLEATRLFGNNNGLGVAVVNLNGGILHANAGQDEYFENISAITLGERGVFFDTNGKKVATAVKLSSAAGENSGLVKQGQGSLELKGVNTYTGETLVEEGTLALSEGGKLLETGVLRLAGSESAFDISGADGGRTIGVLEGIAGSRVELGDNTLSLGDASNQTFAGAINGVGGVVKQGSGTQTLTGASTYTGGTTIADGTLLLNGAGALAATGAVNLSGASSVFDIVTADSDRTIGALAGVAGSKVELGTNTLRFGDASDQTFAGAIHGAGGVVKQGSGTQIFSGANTHAGETLIAQGLLRAGAVNTLSADSLHGVASGATLDLAGFDQTVAGLSNGGTVRLSTASPGVAPHTTLKVTGSYVGNNGNLLVSTVLGADNSASDHLLLSGATAVASGSTLVHVTNAGGLGALTTGGGIPIVLTENGASLQADAFTLAGEHIDAGAYEYRLFQNAHGASLHSRARNSNIPPDPGNPAYRNEVPLLSALAAQLRQADTDMLGNLHKRMGDEWAQDDGAQNQGPQQERRAWGRLLRTSPKIKQAGTVSPESDGHLTGFQAGLDLYAEKNLKLGFYVGQLEGDMHVRGFASGIEGKRVGSNRLRNRYLGLYGTWQGEAGMYADAVLQHASYKSSVHTGNDANATTKGTGWQASLELGKPYALSAGWQIEPQLQFIYRDINLDDTTLSEAQVKNRADNDWMLRLGARIKGRYVTSSGVLQPYGRINLYKSSSTTDVASFSAPAGTTDIVSRGGYLATELAAGATWQLSRSTGLYGEVGKTWANRGDTRLGSGWQVSAGMKVLW